MRYICKQCGAESPEGIGYAANGQTEFPAPAADCQGPHARTRYAIQDPTSGLYVHALAQYTQPSATPDVAQAKTWAARGSARAAIERHALTNVEVVEVTR